MPVWLDSSIEPVISMFRDALADGRIGLLAQGIVDIDDTDKILYSECLARLIDANGRVRLASEFVPALEASGGISTLDRYVVRQVLEELSADCNSVLGCNISAETLSDRQAWSIIVGMIADQGSVANRLVLEVTETRPLGVDRNEARERLSEIQNLGCRVAVDDFGAGHFSPSSLLFIDVDIVKIDASIIRNLRVGTDGVNSLDCIVGFASCTASIVVVEGVETQLQLDTARHAGATHAQGFYISRAEYLAPAEKQNRPVGIQVKRLNSI